MSIRIQTYLLVVSCIVFVSDCARILAVAPLPSYSHQVAFRPIWKQLSLKGHSVTLITTDPINDPSLVNLTEISTHNSSYDAWRSSGVVEFLKEYRQNPITAILKLKDKYTELYTKLLDATMEHIEVHQLLKNNIDFDLVITEPLIPVGVAFAKYFKSKLIFVLSLDAPAHIHIAMGNPFHPVLYPDVNLAITPNSYLKRVFSCIFTVYYFYFTNSFEMLTTNTLRKYFGENLGSFKEDLSRINMVFINVNPIFGGIRPVTPATVYFGRGTHLEPQKPLPDDIKNYLDEAENGVVYFSLGTNMLSKDLPEEKKTLLLEVFSELPFRILWKYEDDELTELPKNVRVMKWVPQQDVLRHSSIKAFITQGGLQSLEEAIFSKVPIIGMPQFGDQIANIERVAELDLGVYVDFENVNKEDLKNIILDVATNQRYREKLEHFIKLSTDWPTSGIEDAVWWTEYVLRHNNTEHLKGPERNIPLYQYLLLDVLAGLFFIISVIIYLIIKMAKLIGKFVKFILKKVASKLHKD